MAEHRTIEDQKTDDSMLLGSEAREDAKALRHDEAQRLAERIAIRLFTNGAGAVADRLVLTIDTPAKRDLGGWCFGAVVDQVRDAILRSDVA